MKKLLAITAASLLLGAGSAMALPLTLSDVGGVDTFKYSANLPNSGDQYELDWINDQLGTSYTLAQFEKYDTPEGAGWTPVDSTSLVAFAVPDTTEYFLVKTGNLTPGAQGAHDVFLFENEDNLAWAVLDLAASYNGFTINQIGKLSHIDTVGGDPVPEPTTMMLLGSGLIGLAGLRRKKE